MGYYTTEEMERIVEYCKKLETDAKRLRETAETYLTAKQKGMSQDGSYTLDMAIKSGEITNQLRKVCDIITHK